MSAWFPDFKGIGNKPSIVLSILVSRIEKLAYIVFCGKRTVSDEGKDLRLVSYTTFKQMVDFNEQESTCRFLSNVVLCFRLRLGKRILKRLGTYQDDTLFIGMV